MYFVLFLVLLYYPGIAGKRVMLNTITGDIKDIGNTPVKSFGERAPIGLFDNINFTKAYNNNNTPMLFTKGSDIPKILRLDFQDVFVTTWKDTSDSAFIYTNQNDTSKRVLTGFYDFPSPMGNFGAAVGAAQFIPNIGGTLIVDTLRLYMFVLPTQKQAKNSYFVLPVYIKNTNLNDTTLLKKNNGISFDFNGNDFDVLPGADQVEIKADTLNNRWETINGQQYVKYIFLAFNPPLTITNNNFGFVIFQGQQNPDTVRIVGAYEWGLSPYSTYGCIMRHNNNNDTVHSTYQFFWNFSAEYKQYFQPLDQKPIKQNFEMVLYGQYQAGVEELNPNAEYYSLEQNYPNPVSESSKIKFSILQSAQVNIDVYNTLGQKVSELVDEFLAPGTYTSTFNSLGLPSGAYIYTLRAGSYTTSKVMQVIR
jgi:hypothetical protein